MATLDSHAAAAKARRTKPQDALQDLGNLSALQIDDSEFADIVARYSLSRLVSARLNGGQLSDPAGLLEWTEYFRTQHRMSEDLVLLSAPIEIADWEEPENAQFVYSRQDKRVYLADVDDLSDPKRIIERARLGISMWPSIGAFIGWYIGA